jgi:L-ribulokinase
MNASTVIGLDYGTNSVRALVVNTANGRELGTAVWNYEQGDAGVLLSRDPNLARQHPADYVKGAERAIRGALADGRRRDRGFRAGPGGWIGSGHDGQHAYAGGSRRAGAGVAAAVRARSRGDGLAVEGSHGGGGGGRDHRAGARTGRSTWPSAAATYSSEWFFSKILHCRRTAPKVFEAAAHAGWNAPIGFPAMLTGTEAPEQLTVGVCAAGHKAMYHDAWGGYPDAEFLGLDPKLGELRRGCRRKRMRWTRRWAD